MVHIYYVYLYPHKFERSTREKQWRDLMSLLIYHLGEHPCGFRHSLLSSSLTFLKQDLIVSKVRMRGVKKIRTEEEIREIGRWL